MLKVTLKKLVGFFSILTISLTPVLGVSNSFAGESDAVAIRININSAVKDNRYFLCTPGVGCLSIKAARNGKTFSIYHPVKIRGLFITNAHTMQVHNVGMPASCRREVATNQTLTISGTIVNGGKNSVRVANLSCSLSRG